MIATPSGMTGEFKSDDGVIAPLCFPWDHSYVCHILYAMFLPQKKKSELTEGNLISQMLLVHVLTKKILDGDLFPDFSLYPQPLLTSHPFPLLLSIQSHIAFA